MADWFRLDTSAHNDPKILRLRKKYGWSGYGMYIAIISQMFNESDAKIPTDALDGLTIALGVSDKELSEFIGFCKDVALFVQEDGLLYSERLVSEKQVHVEKSEIARKKAEKRWSKSSSNSSNDADGMQQQSNGNADAMPNQPTNQPTNQGSVAKATPADFQYARSLYDAMLNVNPAEATKHEKNPKQRDQKVKRWAEDFERLRRLDGATDEQIKFVLMWLFESNKKNALFWQKNVRSGKTFREKWSQLIMNCKEDLGKGTLDMPDLRS